MKQKIITDINMLKQRSEETTAEKAYELFKDLEDTLKDKNGCGLCAIQLGIPLRVGIIRMEKCKLDLWNTKMIEKSGRFRFENEGCLSIPGIYIDTARYMDIVIENGDGRRYALTGMEAVVCQHELAHFNGKTMLDFKWRKRR